MGELGARRIEKPCIKITALHALNAALSASRWAKTREASLSVPMNGHGAAFATRPIEWSSLRRVGAGADATLQKTPPPSRATASKALTRLWRLRELAHAA